MKKKPCPFPRFKNQTFSLSVSLSLVLIPPSRLPRFLPPPSFPPSSSPTRYTAAPPSYALHGRRCGRRPPPPPPHRQSLPVSLGFPGSRAAAPHAPPQLLLPHAQLGHAAPPPMLQEHRLAAYASASGYPVPGQGEGPPFHGCRCRRRRRFAPAAASATVEPSHPPLRHCRAGGSGGGIHARCCAGARAGAARGDQEAGLFHRSLQGGDRPGFCLVPRYAPPAPAQEAPSHGAAAARLALPWIVPRGCDAGLVQDRGEVNADMVEIRVGRDSDVLAHPFCSPMFSSCFFLL